MDVYTVFIGAAGIYCWGALALSILQDSRILSKNVLSKQCNLTSVQLQIDIPNPVAMFQLSRYCT